MNLRNTTENYGNQFYSNKSENKNSWAGSSWRIQSAMFVSNNKLNQISNYRAVVQLSYIASFHAVPALLAT